MATHAAAANRAYENTRTWVLRPSLMLAMSWRSWPDAQRQSVPVRTPVWS
ncbi:MAG TPA: hypothetical protein VN969_19535 [Streptosporangiaceae bacterium]|nr:hypothetical protein [Streptosporangiaceae bacterium]